MFFNPKQNRHPEEPVTFSTSISLCRRFAVRKLTPTRGQPEYFDHRTSKVLVLHGSKSNFNLLFDTGTSAIFFPTRLVSDALATGTSKWREPSALFPSISTTLSSKPGPSFFRKTIRWEFSGLVLTKPFSTCRLPLCG